MAAVTPSLDMAYSKLGMHHPAMADETMGGRIRRLRDARGMQQTELAGAAGVRPHTMWRYEADQSRPGADKLERIAEALGVTSRYLLRGEEDPVSPETHLEPVEDEERPVAERAIVALGRTTDEERALLRQRVAALSLRSDDPVSSYVTLLERELERIRAEARGAAPKVEDKAEAVKTELPPNAGRFGRGGKRGR